MKREVNRWYKKLWETKGARFIAANRLELHNNWSTIVVSLSSVYVIAINLLMLFPECKRNNLLCDENITYSTICLSVLILAISIIITSKNYKLRADKFHECGREIDKLYNKICVWRSLDFEPTEAELQNISEDYCNILDKYENHKYIDYQLFQTNNLTEYQSITHKNWFWFKTKTLYYIETIGFYLLIIIIPPIIGLLIYFK